MSLNEFERRPSGIILPNKKIIKRLHSKRIVRVLWKLTKGIFFIKKNVILHDNVARNVELISPDEIPPNSFIIIANTTSEGEYQGIFAYRFKEFETKESKFYICAFLFWDKIISVVTFHDPKCKCKKCRS